jgi:hypothetical protein
MHDPRDRRRDAGLIQGEIEGPATCYCLSADGLRWLARPSCSLGVVLVGPEEGELIPEPGPGWQKPFSAYRTWFHWPNSRRFLGVVRGSSCQGAGKRQFI